MLARKFKRGFKKGENKYKNFVTKYAQKKKYAIEDTSHLHK